MLPTTLALLLAAVTIPDGLTPIPDIAPGLAATTADPADVAARIPLYQQLDAYARIEGISYYPPMIDLFHARMDLALAAIEQPPASGARIVKTYSSGFLIRTGEVCFGIDVVRPLRTRPPEGTPAEPFEFQMTPAQTGRLVDVLDVLFVSHKHHDHCDIDLIKALLTAGKTVITARDPQLEGWLGELAAKVTWSDGSLAELPGLRYEGYLARQGMVPGENDAWPSTDKDVPNIAFRIEAGGLAFYHTGDNRGESPVPWLTAGKEAGRPLDVMLPCLTWPRDLMRDVEALYPNLIMIPGHEYEFTHLGTGVGILYDRLRGVGDRRLAARHGTVMFWGDALDLAPAAAGQSAAIAPAAVGSKP